MYDQLGSREIGGFSFGLDEEPAPHAPLPLYWHRGLASLESLVALDPQLVEAAAGAFLSGLDDLLADTEEKSL
ncbi:hypothetical protein [Haliangium ochraceum]|uniref:hypothetical protein n=1 Tax=Haliangium ochraceum TaxID=80816 RepID=UPI00019BB7E5|nr:hypothetical protein [Haliangium ochraceum]